MLHWHIAGAAHLIKRCLKILPKIRQYSATRPTQITSSSGLKKPDWLVSNFEPVGEWRKDIALPHPDAFFVKVSESGKA
jgi:hypothetical protein